MAWPKDMSVQELSSALGAIHPNQDAKLASTLGATTPAPPNIQQAAQVVQAVPQPMTTVGWAITAGLLGLGVWWYWKSRD